MAKYKCCIAANYHSSDHTRQDAKVGDVIDDFDFDALIDPANSAVQDDHGLTFFDPFKTPEDRVAMIARVWQQLFGEPNPIFRAVPDDTPLYRTPKDPNAQTFRSAPKIVLAMPKPDVSALNAFLKEHPEERAALVAEQSERHAAQLAEMYAPTHALAIAMNAALAAEEAILADTTPSLPLTETKEA